MVTIDFIIFFIKMKFLILIFNLESFYTEYIFPPLSQQCLDFSKLYDVIFNLLSVSQTNVKNTCSLFDSHENEKGYLKPFSFFLKCLLTHLFINVYFLLYLTSKQTNGGAS